NGFGCQENDTRPYQGCQVRRIDSYQPPFVKRKGLLAPGEAMCYGKTGKQKEYDHEFHGQSCKQAAAENYIFPGRPSFTRKHFTECSATHPQRTPAVGDSYIK